MRLTNLLAELDVLQVRGDPASVHVRGITCHSDGVGPGDVFVCIRGLRHDGHHFIDAALRRGAAALVVDKDLFPSLRPPAGVAVVGVDDTRLAHGLLCAVASGRPSRHIHVTGITGTNGKTTCALFLDAVLRAAGLATGLITTVFSRINDETMPQRLTTPDAETLQSLLARMRNAHVERAVLEISSHALQMHRVAGTRLQTAVFTNLTRDHLDYHGDWDEYRHAKARIFSLLDRRTGVAVLNVDDSAGRQYARSLAKSGPSRLVTYGMRHCADVRGRLLRPAAIVSSEFGPMKTPQHMHPGHRLEIATPDGTITIPLPEPGFAHASNALTAAATAWAQGVALSTIARGLIEADLPPGRFQQIVAGQPFHVYVDFAHNPSGLAHALGALRRQALPGTRLRLVFGCKGDDGDAVKRRLMGRIAARHADEIIVTTDNPQGECPRRIAEAVAQGIAATGFPSSSYTVMLDRTEAIRTVVSGAEPGDIVLIAGRGHEREQRFGAERVPLDDAAVALQWLRDRYGPTPIGEPAVQAGVFEASFANNVR